MKLTFASAQTTFAYPCEFSNKNCLSIRADEVRPLREEAQQFNGERQLDTHEKHLKSSVSPDG